MPDEEVTKDTPKQEEKEKPQGSAPLTEEQVNELLNKARQQEKDKLYPQIEELGTTVKGLQAQLRAEAEKKAEIESAAQQKAEEERKAKLSAEQLLAESMRKIEEQLANEREARVALETKLQQQRRSEELAAYRSRKIAEAKIEILPELVRGNSEAEIDASTQIAKAREEEIVAKVKQERQNDVRSNMPGPANPDTAAREEAELRDSIDNIEIDTARYAKDKEYRAEMDTKRAAVMARLGEAYARASGV